MKSQGIPDFQAPPPIPKFIDAQEAMVQSAKGAHNELDSLISPLPCTCAGRPLHDTWWHCFTVTPLLNL